MKVDLQKEHAWLQKLVGEWTFEHDAQMGPDQPTVKVTGTDVVRPLGGAWIICEGKAELPGSGTGLNVMTLGYDTDKKKFVGTFITSVMSYLWVYEGELDASGKVLTLNTEGPDWVTPGKTAKYKDAIEIVSDSHRMLRSVVQGADGKWTTFMEAHYRRK